MTTTHTTLLDEARGLLDDTVALRRRIHRHPEIGLDLPRTQQTVLEALDGLGLKTRTGQKTTSVVATLRRRPARARTCCCAPTWTPCPCRKTPAWPSPPRSTAPCTPAVTTRTSPCWSAPRGCWPRDGDRCPAASCSCSSPARRAITAPR